MQPVVFDYSFTWILKRDCFGPRQTEVQCWEQFTVSYQSGILWGDSEKVWPELCLALGITTPKWFTNKKNTCHNDSWKGNVYNVFFFLQWKTKVGHMIHNHQSTCSSTVNPCEKGQDYLKQCHDQDQCKFFFLTLFLNIHQLPNYFYRKHSIQMKVKNNNT